MSPEAGANALRDSLARLSRDVVACERCPRLRAWCTKVAQEKVKRFRDDDYWGRPVPGFGDRRAQLLIVGLAPAAHGANRTGRVFTGDRSGDFLFAALHRAGFANQAESTDAGDGLRLENAFVTPIVRCAPPANKPSRDEILACRDYLEREWRLFAPRLRAVLVLGRVGMDGLLAMLRESGLLPVPRGLAFGHGVTHELAPGLKLFCSYHPSQQNTFTGRLTPRGFDAVMRKIHRHLAGAEPALGRAPKARRTT